MSFGGIIGNRVAIEMLQKAVQSERISHAYLFQGPEGVGKGLIAKNFAKVLNCLKNGTDACEKCVSCRKINSGNHPDVHWYRPIGVMRMIKVEQIRDFIQNVNIMPYEGRKKVFIVVDADRMNIESQNRLLKTLEEPPGPTVIILTSANPNALLPTILSRCQRINFFTIPRAEIEEYIVKKGKADREKARLVSSLCHGQVGTALKLLDEKKFDQRVDLYRVLSKNRFEMLDDLVEKAAELEGYLKEMRSRLETELYKENAAIWENLATEQRDAIKEEHRAFAESEFRREVDEIMNFLAIWYRDLLILKETENIELVTNSDMARSYQRLAREFERVELLKNLEAIEEARRAIGLNIKLSSSLEALFVKLGLLDETVASSK